MQFLIREKVGWQWLRRICFAALAGAVTLPAAALHIVVTNDDGFESRNLQALFTALKAAGHDVILSAPYREQSGASAVLGLLANIPTTTTPSAGGRIAAGAPGVGPTTIAADQYYVDSSPVASVLYGIDYPAQTKWHAPPDLVIAGPNVGNNLGVITPHSGTVGAAIVALNRGIPAIAASAANGDAATANLLAAIILRVVTAIDVRGKVALPVGIGLNVNVPALDAARTAASYRVAFTQIGSVGEPDIRFYLDSGALPVFPTTPDSVARNVASEDRVFAEGNTVTVSPIQGTFQAPPDQAALVLTQMRSLFATTAPITNPKLINISVRGVVGAGSAAQIAGFVVAGSAAKTVLIRAAGPALGALGVADCLANPKLELFDSAQRLVAANDNWSDDPETAGAVAAAAAKVGAFAWADGSKDAALIITLPPGAYTAVAKGVSGATGIALIEVYDVNID